MGTRQPLIMGGDAEVTNKLFQLESEVSQKKQEINELREQVRQGYQVFSVFQILWNHCFHLPLQLTGNSHNL